MLELVVEVVDDVDAEVVDVDEGLLEVLVCVCVGFGCSVPLTKAIIFTVASFPAFAS